MKIKALFFTLTCLLAMPASAQIFQVGAEGFDADTNNWPGGEAPGFAIDGVAAKYLNFGKENTGIAVTPAGGSAAAAAITLWSANDEVPRDPASFSVYGTNDAITASSPGDLFSGFTLIASDAIALPADRGGSGMDALEAAKSATVAFANDTAYLSYIVVFPTLADSGNANSMQVAEIQLNTAAGAPIFSANDAILGGQLIPEPSTAILALLGLIPALGRNRRR